MLTDDDKQRIRAEEIFRDEVRHELKKPKKTSAKLWQFFNSALGIFTLSSIGLSGFTFVFTECHNAAVAATTREEEVRKLNIEIGYRVAYLKPLSQAEFNYIDIHNARAATVGSPQSEEDVGRVDFVNPIFPEYKERTLASLLWELKKLTKEDGDAVVAAFNAAEALPTFIADEERTMDLVKPVGENSSVWRFKRGLAERYEKEVITPFKQPKWDTGLSLLGSSEVKHPSR